MKYARLPLAELFRRFRGSRALIVCDRADNSVALIARQFDRVDLMPAHAPPPAALAANISLREWDCFAELTNAAYDAAFFIQTQTPDIASIERIQAALALLQERHPFVVVAAAGTIELATALARLKRLGLRHMRSMALTPDSSGVNPANPLALNDTAVAASAAADWVVVYGIKKSSHGINSTPDRSVARSADAPERSRHGLADELIDCSQLPFAKLVAIAQGNSAAAPLNIPESQLRAAAAASSPASFAQTLGIPEGQSTQLAAIIEVGRRLFAPPADRAVPRSVNLNHWIGILSSQPVEQLRLLCLDSERLLLAEQIVASGGACSAAVAPRELLHCAARVGASAIILLHNHPGGDPAPSLEDIEMTRAVSRAAATIGIALDDHMIIAGGQLLSMRQAGLI